MDRDLTLKYLVHLNGVLEKLSQKSDLSREDLASLERELAIFREKAMGVEHLGPATKALVAELCVKCDLRAASRLKRNWWTYALAPFALGSMNRARRAEEQGIIRTELDRLQNNVREVHYAAQF